MRDSNSNSLHKVKLNSWVIYLSPVLESLKIEPLDNKNEFPLLSKLSEIERVTASAGAIINKGILNTASSKQSVYHKEYLDRSRKDQLKQIVRANRAIRSVNASMQLINNGFNTANILAYGWKKGLISNSHLFTLTEAIEDARNVYQIISEFEKGNSAEMIETKYRFIYAIANEIAKLHAKGFSHGDLRAGNILVQEEKTDWKFYFIDNERTVKYNRLPEKLRVKNLVQINMLISPAISKRDRLRFFNEYIKHQNGIKKRSLIDKVMITTELRLKKLLAQGRITQNQFELY